VLSGDVGDLVREDGGKPALVHLARARIGEPRQQPFVDADEPARMSMRVDAWVLTHHKRPCAHVGIGRHHGGQALADCFHHLPPLLILRQREVQLATRPRIGLRVEIPFADGILAQGIVDDKRGPGGLRERRRRASAQQERAECAGENDPERNPQHRCLPSRIRVRSLTASSWMPFP